MINSIKRKSKLEIIIPIIVAIIVVVIFVYLDYRLVNKEPEPEPEPESSQTEIPTDIPDKHRDLDPNFDYGCGGPGSINLTTVKEPDSVWIVGRDNKTRTISLGKYKINPPKYTVLDVSKLWIYFTSEVLSNRDDKWYGLESSYVSGMTLKVNNKDREIKLGGDEYMFIELPDYPLGDFRPYENIDVEFEVLVELKCNNLEKRFLGKNTCIGNNGEELKYIDKADIRANIRVFAIGCQDFTQDIVADANFKYGN